MEENVRDLLSRIKRPHPDENLGISLPYYQHHEENRQAKIRHYDFHHPGGWIPCGDNWWQFPQTQRQYDEGVENHKAMNRHLRDMGFDLYDPTEPD